MKLTVALAVLIGILVLACSSAAPAPAEPTPNIDATVEARVKQEVVADATVVAKLIEERSADATIVAKLKQELAAQPTLKPQVIIKEVPVEVIKEVEKEVVKEVIKEVEVVKKVPVTVTPIPTSTPTPVPTATPSPTPNPLLIEFVVSKAVDWDFRGTGEYHHDSVDYLYNCYDLKTSNTNNVPIDLTYSLTALDNDGVSYKSGWAHIQSLSGWIQHLEPGQTYYDKRCWGGGGTGPTDPVTRMELSIDELTASTILGNDVGVGEWQEIGEGGNLEQYVKFINEPQFPAGYPEEDYGMRWTQREVANTSETKTLHVRTCVAWLWRESSMYRQSQYGDAAAVLASIAVDIRPDTLFSNICRDARISPKTTGKLDTNTSPAANGWLYPNLYEKILGIWVREE